MSIRYEDYYGINENGNIICVGVRLKDGAVCKMPMKGCRLDRKALVEKSIVFYNIELDKHYDLYISQYIKGTHPRFEVKYGGTLKSIDAYNLINKCQIGNIINEKIIRSSNKFYKKDNHFALTINVKGTVNEKYFDSDFIEVMFDGSLEVVEAIRNSTWCISRSKSRKFYAQTANYNKTGTVLKLHQVILEDSNTQGVIDHVNHNTFDNRTCNLRRVKKSENNKNKKGAGYPKKVKNGWRYNISINGQQTSTPIKRDYTDADIDALIIQKHFNYKHRENEFYKLENIEEEYKEKLIKLISNKINKAKTNGCKFTQNKYEIVLLDNKNIVKIYDNKNNFTYISIDDIYVLDLGRITKSTNYWQIKINKKNYMLHRYILGISETNIDSIQVDHINHQVEDNRRENLIITTKEGNLANIKSRGYRWRRTHYEVYYICYWNYISIHNEICDSKNAFFKTKTDAEEEVYRRKYLANHIRPQFKNYQEYLSFKNECRDDSVDKYWIEKMFPNINKIIIPNV